MERMIRKNFYLTRSQAKLLKQLANLLGITESEYMRRALDQFFQPDNPIPTPPTTPPPYKSSSAAATNWQ